jgi:hypothetical protein
MVGLVAGLSTTFVATRVAVAAASVAGQRTPIASGPQRVGARGHAQGRPAPDGRTHAEPRTEDNGSWRYAGATNAFC